MKNLELHVDEKILYRQPFIEIVDIKDKLLRILASYFDVFAICLIITSGFH